jgi:hypothetical protein
MKKFPLEIRRDISEMSCVPITSYNYVGKVTVNGIPFSMYEGQNKAIGDAWPSCAIRQGNKLKIQTDTGSQKFKNTVSYVDGLVNGTLHFGPASVYLNGKGTFQ